MTSRVMAFGRRRGSNSLYFFMGLEDRDRVLAALAGKVYQSDPTFSIDDIRVSTIDGMNEAGIHMVCRRRPRAGENPETTQQDDEWAMARLEQELAALDGQQIPGERFASARTVRVAIESENRPGTLKTQTITIAEYRGNIRELTSRMFSDRALLSYTIAFPSDDDKLLADMKARIEAGLPGAKVGYDADAAKMEQEFPAYTARD